MPVEASKPARPPALSHGQHGQYNQYAQYSQYSQSRSAPRFVTVAEVAAQLRVSNMTVYRLVQSGELPAVRVGRSYRIREEDVDRYLAGRYTEAG